MKIINTLSIIFLLILAMQGLESIIGLDNKLSAVCFSFFCFCFILFVMDRTLALIGRLFR